MKFICKILVLIFVFVFFTGCTSNNLKELENRVSYLESQLGISYVEPTEVPKNNYVTLLEDVFKSYSYSSTFAVANYPYGCYKINDYSLPVLSNKYITNIISYILATKQILTNDSHLTIEYVEFGNEIDAKNMLAAMRDDIIENQYSDMYILTSDVTVMHLRDYTITAYDSVVHEIDDNETHTANIINMRHVYVAYRIASGIFYINADWKINEEDFTNIIIDSCKAVGLVDIDSLFNR